MNNFDELQAVWQSADTSNLHGPADMMLLVKKYRNKTVRKKTGLIVSALAAVALMFSVMLLYNSTMPTTRIGEWLVIIAAGILAWTNTRSIGRFRQLQNCSNKDFLLFLEKTRQNQLYFFKRTQVMGLVCCSVGLLLYIFEFVQENVLRCIIAYGVLIAYLLIMWLVVRPRVFKKQSAKLNRLVKQTESLIEQLK